MSIKAKKASESFTSSSRIVLPNDTNVLGNLMGGQLLSWMDITAAIAARRHTNRVVVTASVNNVSFEKPIKLGDTVTIEAKVSRAFHSSMEIYMDVFVEGAQGQKIKCNEAIYTFVAIDQNENPIEIPELIPETELEIERYKGALRRRQLALVLAGKMKPTEATELKAILDGN